MVLVVSCDCNPSIRLKDTVQKYRRSQSGGREVAFCGHDLYEIGRGGADECIRIVMHVEPRSQKRMDRCMTPALQGPVCMLATIFIRPVATLRQRTETWRTARPDEELPIMLVTIRLFPYHCSSACTDKK